MEVWLAKVMDFTVMYETQTYAAQHPVSFVNWLPLDPMHHSTEFIENKKVREYDNDLEQLDFRKYNATQLFVPGIFASYHAYPYYPDFIYLQKNYTTALNTSGIKDSYYGYLDDLKKHVPDMPLIIAEYGLPSSRGNSHYTPSGFNQGGLSEQQQADLSHTLTEDIYHTKCGGAIFFEWIDEWFKFNWLVMDFEQPYERRKMWHNMENPEQNFGIMAIESGGKTIDGNLSDWKIQLLTKDETVIHFDADASYFYISAQLPDFDIKKQKLYFAIDTYDKDKGDHRLPFLQKTLDHGIEFLVCLDNPGNSRILVDAPYSVYTDIYKDLIPVYASQNNSNANFIDEILLSNRERVSLMGDSIKQITHNRSKLQFGKSNLPDHSNADWFWNEKTKILELRLDWHLLNVCDPSGRHVLDDKEGTPNIKYTKTEGFYIYPFVTNKKEVQVENTRLEKEYFFKWDTWDDHPLYKKRLKPIYTTFKNLFPTLVPLAGNIKIEKEEFTIAPFYDNKPGAISILFDGSDYSQYETALPVLNKYQIKATFGAVDEWVNNSSSTVTEDNGLKIKKMGWIQLTELLQTEHEIALQLLPHENNKRLSAMNQAMNLKAQKKGLESKLASPVSTIYYTNNLKKIDWASTLKNSGFLFGCNMDTTAIESMKSRYALTPLSALSHSLQSLDSMLLSENNKWQIFQYPHFSEATYKKKVTRKEDRNNLTTAELFERQIRLIRNSNSWIAPIAVVGKYVEERNVSVIKSTSHNNVIFLTVVNTLSNEFNQTLTIVYATGHRKIKISKSPADGIYEAKNGVIYFQVIPNKEITIEIIDP